MRSIQFGTFLPRVVAAALFLGATPAVAQEQPAPASAPPPALERPVATAPVVIDGVPLFRVRGVASYPAEERAQQIISRVTAFARDPALAPDSVRAVADADYTTLVAGSLVLLSVVDADAALDGVSRPVLAEVFRRRIVTVVEGYRRDRTSQALVNSSLQAALALVVGAAVLFALRVGFRRMQELSARRFKARVGDAQIRGFSLLSAEQLWSALQAAFRAIYWLVILAIALVVLRFVLGLFPWTRGTGQGLGAMVLEPLSLMGTGTLNALPNLTFLAILFFVVRYLLGLVRLFFDAVAHRSVSIEGFDPDWAVPTYKLLRLAVVAFALVVAYPYIPGSQTDAFRGVTVFLGVVFSLGSSSVIGNIIAGYSMTYRRAFRPGDRVRIEDHVGDIVDVRLLVTHLRTPKNEDVVIPNSVILNGSIINYTTLAREGLLLLHTTVGIGYETPWRQVEAMLIEAARRTDGLLPEPPPFVLQQSLGDFAIAYEINAACREANIMGVIYTRLHRNILDVFNEHGVQIMTPAYEGDPEQPKIVPKERWHEAPAEPPEASSRASGRPPVPGQAEPP